MVVICLSVCLLVTLRKDFETDLHEIFREGWQGTLEQNIKFWWLSGSRIRIRIRIVTLVRRALAKVCTVPVTDFSSSDSFSSYFFFFSGKETVQITPLRRTLASSP